MTQNGKIQVAVGLGKCRDATKWEIFQANVRREMPRLFHSLTLGLLKGVILVREEHLHIHRFSQRK